MTIGKSINQNAYSLMLTTINKMTFEVATLDLVNYEQLVYAQRDAPIYLCSIAQQLLGLTS